MNTSGMGHKILDARYVLLECLAVSAMGEIYRGRDLELVQTEDSPSRILIHLLPRDYHLTNRAAKFAKAQELTQSVNKLWILPLLAQGQTDNRFYFVLQSPEGLGAQSVMSLPSQQLPSTSKLAQQFAGLVKTQQLPEVLDSALLLTLPNNNLYLLATAFIPELHRLRARHTGLRLYKPTTLKRTVALMGIMAIALSTFAVEYRAKPKSSSTQTTEKPILGSLSSPKILLAQPELAAHDIPIKNPNLALPLALEEPLPAIEPALVALSSQAIKAAENQPTNTNIGLGKPLKKLEFIEFKPIKEKTATTTKPEEKPKLVIAKPKATETVPAVKTESTAQTVAQASIKASSPIVNGGAIYHTASVETTPVTHLKKLSNSAPPTLTINDLIERANRALDEGNFNQKNGVLFYTRQIKMRDHLHPQVERLGRSVVMYQHQIVRSMLKKKEFQHAYSLLNNSKSLIQEFNLKSLNSAQQLLEHKSNQTN